MNLQFSGKVSPGPWPFQERQEVQNYAMYKEPPWGSKEKQRDLAECPKREALWVEVGEREEPSYSARRKGSKPRRQRRVRKAEAKCHLCLFPPLKTEQSSWVWWPLRKTSHFLRGYQASPGIVSGFQQWPPLPDQHRSRSFCCAGRSCQSGLSAFHRASFSSAVHGKCLQPQGHGPKAGLTAHFRMLLGLTTEGKMWLGVLLTILLCEC